MPRSRSTATLGPGERRSIRFAVAWDMPMVEFGAGRRWWKRYARSWGRTGERAWDLATHAFDHGRRWRSAIEAWQAPILDDPERPGWYKAALFNELYFLVDGGTFWEAGEVDGPEPEPGDIGRFALLECIDYPFYDTVDVDFYASFAVLELFPDSKRAGSATCWQSCHPETRRRHDRGQRADGRSQGAMGGAARCRRPGG